MTQWANWRASCAPRQKSCGRCYATSRRSGHAPRGGDEGWSVVEVLCHLRDTEERALERMRAMRNKTNPLIHGYDQEPWARERAYAGDNMDSAFAAFVGLRAQHVVDLDALRPDEWERPGRHGEAGAVTILSHTIHIAHHDAVHAAQIAPTRVMIAASRDVWRRKSARVGRSRGVTRCACGIRRSLSAPPRRRIVASPSRWCRGCANRHASRPRSLPARTRH